MLEQSNEVRCPNDLKVLGALSDTFDGAVSFVCHRCHATVEVGASPPERRLKCRCGKWLASGVIRFGTITVKCRWDGALVEIGADESRYLEAPKPKRIPFTARVDSLAALVEERWTLMRHDRNRRSVEVAVGLRFDVFNRDGFRCVYCGRGVAQGVMLEADHVIPRSDGGPDTLENLVTACWDCNSGKSAKRINTVDVA